MITDMKGGAGALGAKTARACDSCLRRRARWFCGADDAFLCHGCDNLVHSANQLASRHERVRLQTASCKVVTTTAAAQAWHSGFTRKARTPRHNKHLALQQRLKDQVLFNTTCVLPVVPELGVEEPLLDADESEEQLLCRVPVFDPFDAELCSVYNEVKSHGGGGGGDDGCDLDSFSEFLPSDMDLAVFAADVETLLGSGIDEDSSSPADVKKGSSEDIEGVVRSDACVQGEGAKSSSAAMVKVEDEEEEEEQELDADTACHLESVLDMTSDAFDWNLDSVLSPSLEHEEKTVLPAASTNGSDVAGDEVRTKRDIFLRLNYEDVIAAWASQGCPWTTGNPPKFNSDDIDYWWPNFLDAQCSSYGGVRSLRGQIVGGGDGGREARVSRYREKRRTRLFAKKIRYEVRKLNAEKRPRMKGRFVKRACFVGASNNAASAAASYH